MEANYQVALIFFTKYYLGKALTKSKKIQIFFNKLSLNKILNKKELY